MKLICRIRPTTQLKQKDAKVNIFTASVAHESIIHLIKAPQKLVVSCKHAISTKLINECLRSDEDIVKQRTSILENAELFQFDQAFGDRTNSQAFYDYVCASKINDCLNGVSSNFVIMGGTESGKKYTLKGEDKGIASLAVEAVLNLFEIQKQSKTKSLGLEASIYCANEQEIVDLIGNVRSAGIKKTRIQYLTDFKNIMRQGLHQLKQYSRETHLQSNIIISLYVKQDKGLISQINFIVLSEFKKQTNEAFEFQTKFKQFLSIAPELHGDEKLPLGNKIIEAICLAFNQANYQNINIIFQVSSLQAHFIEAFRTLQFADELKSMLKPPTKKSTKQSILENESMNYGSQTQINKSKVSFGGPEFGSKTSLNDRPGSSQNILIKSKENIPMNHEQSLQSQKQFSELKDLLREKEKLEDFTAKRYEQEIKNLLEENYRLQSRNIEQQEQLANADIARMEMANQVEELQKRLNFDQQMYLTARHRETEDDQLREMIQSQNQQLRICSEEAVAHKHRVNLLEQEIAALKQDQSRSLRQFEQREYEYLQALRAEKERNEEGQGYKQKLLILEQDLETVKAREIQTQKQFDKRVDEYMNIIKQEKDRNRTLYEELDYYSQDISNKNQIILKLETNIATLNKVIEEQCKKMEEDRQKQKEIEDILGQKVKKTEDLVRDVAHLETRHAKYKSKLETENHQLKEDKEQYLQKYKEKLKKYKAQLRMADDDYQSLKMQNVHLQSEIEKFNNQLYQLDQKNREYSNLANDNQMLLKQLDEKHYELKQSEQMLEQMCEMSNKQLDEMEQKFQRVSVQVNTLQHEKKSLLSECSNLKINIEQLEGNDQILERRIIKLKRENKELTNQLKELNQNMREMIVEKHSEIKNSLHQSRFSNKLSQNVSMRMKSAGRESSSDDEEYM